MALGRQDCPDLNSFSATDLFLSAAFPSKLMPAPPLYLSPKTLMSSMTPLILTFSALLPSEYPGSATSYSDNCHQILGVVLEPLITSNLISYFAAAFSLSFSHSGHTVGKKANHLSFKSSIKCYHPNTTCGDLPIQLYNPPPYTHPDLSLFCSLSCDLLAFFFCQSVCHVVYTL